MTWNEFQNRLVDVYLSTQQMFSDWPYNVGFTAISMLFLLIFMLLWYGASSRVAELQRLCDSVHAHEAPTCEVVCRASESGADASTVSGLISLHERTISHIGKMQEDFTEALSGSQERTLDTIEKVVHECVSDDSDDE